MEKDLTKEDVTIFGKIGQLHKARIPAWVLALVLAVVVGGFFTYRHLNQDHDSLHIMVNLFNYCLEKRPDCKAMFTPPPTLPTVVPGK